MRLGALLGLALLVGCAAEEPQRIVRYEDFLSRPEAVVALKANEPRVVHCGDETHYAWVLEDGAELSIELSPAADPRLVISGCLSHPSQETDRETGVWRASAPVEGGGGELRAAVEVAAEGQSAAAAGFELDPAAFTGWWSRELDLEALSGRQATLRVTARLPAGRELYLSHLYLEHRVTAPAVERGDEAEGAPPRVLLISVDTLRADALGGEWKTPHLDRLAAEGETWSPHYATASWTKPSHATLLTGYPPHIYGGHEGPLDERVPTLAERLSAAGLATFGLVHDCVWLNPRFGFGRGFDSYRSTLWQIETSIRETSNWIGEHRDEPFFAFLHVFEPHSDFHRLPYEAPGVNRESVAKRFGFPNYGCTRRVCASGRLARMQDGRIRPRGKDPEILRHLYGEGVEHLDAQLGRLLDDLRELGVYDEMTIVVTADHGESLLEDGRVLHGNSSQEVLRVPLIIKWPGGEHAGVRRDKLSSSLDLVPTLLAAYDLPHDDLPGSPLHLRRADRPAFAGVLWSAVIQGDLKGVYDPRTETWELYDLAADPAARHDLAAERRDDVRRLAGLMSAHRADTERRLAAAGELRRRSEEGGLTAEERDRLRALGYLGGS